MDFKFSGVGEVSLITQTSTLNISTPTTFSYETAEEVAIEGKNYSFVVGKGSEVVEGIGLIIMNAVLLSGHLPLPVKHSLSRSDPLLKGDMREVLPRSNVAIARLLSHRIDLIDPSLRKRLSINGTEYEISIRGNQADLDKVERHIEGMVKREFNLSESDPMMCDCGKGDHCMLWENGEPRKEELLERNLRLSTHVTSGKNR